MSMHRVSPVSSPAVGARPRSRVFCAILRMACVAAPLALAACATELSTEPSPAAVPALFDDARFAPSTEPIDPADVFRMTPDMDAYLRRLLDSKPAPGERRVVYPGMEEAEAETDRLARGIPYHPEVIDWFRSICAETGAACAV